MNGRKIFGKVQDTTCERRLEDRVIVDCLLLELMGEVAASPLDLKYECGLETVLDALIEEVAEEEMLLRPPGLGMLAALFVGSIILARWRAFVFVREWWRCRML